MVCGRIHAGGQDLKNDRRSVKRKKEAVWFLVNGTVSCCLREIGTDFR